MRWLGRLDALLADGSQVLDVGCGNGVPATRRLADRHEVTGIDVSAVQIERARHNVPGARLICDEVLNVALTPESFDAISAFYVIDHLPRELHSAVLARWSAWLRPGGYLLFTIEPEDEPGTVRNWLGAPMFFSQYDAERTLELVGEAGFRVLRHAVETQSEGGREVAFLWVLAQK